MYENGEGRVIYDGVTLQRGLGYSGRRISIVEEYCEKCRYDRMVLDERINPERRDDREYLCQNPVCPDYHEGFHIPGKV